MWPKGNSTQIHFSANTRAGIFLVRFFPLVATTTTDITTTTAAAAATVFWAGNNNIKVALLSTCNIKSNLLNFGSIFQILPILNLDLPNAHMHPLSE